MFIFTIITENRHINRPGKLNIAVPAKIWIVLINSLKRLFVSFALHQDEKYIGI